MNTRFPTSALVILLLAVFLPNAFAHADDDRSSLRVLFVGPNPEDIRVGVSEIVFNYGRSEEVYASHTPAFRALLEAHFDQVKVVYGEHYQPEMSDDFDVTIFDAQIPGALPRDWDRASLFVSYVGPNLLGRLRTKLDWL